MKKYTHINRENLWGVGWEETDERGRTWHYFMYSKPRGGLWLEQSSGNSYDHKQVEGTSQFSGKNSRAVRHYIEKGRK